jgi:hypothetical protein
MCDKQRDSHRSASTPRSRDEGRRSSAEPASAADRARADCRRAQNGGSASRRLSGAPSLERRSPATSNAQAAAANRARLQSVQRRLGYSRPFAKTVVQLPHDRRRQTLQRRRRMPRPLHCRRRSRTRNHRPRPPGARPLRRPLLDVHGRFRLLPPDRRWSERQTSGFDGSAADALCGLVSRGGVVLSRKAFVARGQRNQGFAAEAVRDRQQAVVPSDQGLPLKVGAPVRVRSAESAQLASVAHARYSTPTLRYETTCTQQDSHRAGYRELYPRIVTRQYGQELTRTPPWPTPLPSERSICSLFAD